MGKTVGQLEREMSSAELSEWLARCRIHPLPDEYWASANVAYAIASGNYSGKGRRPKFGDFLPKVQGPPKKGAALRRAMIARFGAKPKGGGTRGQAKGRE